MNEVAFNTTPILSTFQLGFLFIFCLLMVGVLFFLKHRLNNQNSASSVNVKMIDKGACLYRFTEGEIEYLIFSNAKGNLLLEKKNQGSASEVS